MVPGTYLASYESASGTSTVILLPAMAVMTRSAGRRVVVVSQVWGAPLRTSASIPIRWIHSAVTGRRMRMGSPTARPAALATANEVAPEGT